MKGSCLLCGGQAVFGSTENTTDQAELVYCELGRLTAFLFLQQAADGETPTVTGGPGQKHKENRQERKMKTGSVSVIKKINKLKTKISYLS